MADTPTETSSWEAAWRWFADGFEAAVAVAKEAVTTLTKTAEWGVKLVTKIFGVDEEVAPEEVAAGLVTKTIEHTDQTVANFIGASWQALAQSGLNRIATTAAIISVTVFGFLALMGRTQISVPEAATRLIKIIIVLYMFGHGGPLLKKSYEILTGTSTAIGEILVDAGRGLDTDTRKESKEVYPTLTSGLDRMGIIALGWYSRLGFSVEAAKSDTLGSLLNAVVGITIFAIGMSIFLILLSKIAIGLLLGLTPFFALFLLFEKTRHLAEGWFRSLLSFSLIPVLLYAVWAILFPQVYAHAQMLSVWTGTVDVTLLDTGVIRSEVVIDNLGLRNTVKMLPYTMVMLATSMLILQVKGWASAIAGGATLGDGLGMLYAKGRVGEEFGGGGGGSRPPGMRRS